MRTRIAESNGEYGFVMLWHLWVRKFLLFCGIAASMIWVGTDIIASLCYEGYNFPFDPISGLSAVDAPTRSFIPPFFNAYLVFKTALSLGVWNAAGKNRSLRITAGLLLASVITDLAGSFFPWNPAESLLTFVNIMHGLLLGVTPVLFFFLTIGFGANADGKRFRRYSYATLVLMIILGALPLLGGVQITADQPPEWFGVTERVNAYGFMLWMMVLAIVLLHNQVRIPRPEDTVEVVVAGSATNRV
jgi:hypothetical protein